ncbi:MAG: hypothetical protein CL919_07870 [Deltaproteobacteria bacterium]|nr:hypothetical protein [Deltaproteobacteria bacterium]
MEFPIELGKPAVFEEGGIELGLMPIVIKFLDYLRGQYKCRVVRDQARFHFCIYFRLNFIEPILGGHPIKCCLGATAKRSDLTVYGCRARLAAIAGVC